MTRALRDTFPWQEPQMGQVERAARASAQRWIIGVDEAGRGPLAGPVYAAAVMLDMHALDAAWLEQINDSKKLSEAKREALFDPIQQGAVRWAIASRDAQVIDDINVLAATKEAMKEAVEAVAQGQTIDRVYIDGNQFLDIALPQSCVVKGDARSVHIAAASILAKVARDRLMRAHHERWPEYDFARHKGYGTKAHREAIALHGPIEIHRKTFGGVREHVRTSSTT